MKRLILTPLLFLLNQPIKSEVNNVMHEKCLQATDYQGCMEYKKRSNSGIKEKKDCSQTICEPDEVTQLTDNLGMKIIQGWQFKENPANRSAIYWDPNVYKINSGGEEGRYYHTRSILRYFQKGRSGSPGSFYSTGGTTDCNQLSYGNLSCTTDPSTTTFLPGTSGRPDQVIQMRNDVIYDCKDETVAVYENKVIQRFKGLDGKRKRWNSWDNLPKNNYFALVSHKPYREVFRKNICSNSFLKAGLLLPSDLNPRFREKGIKKRGLSNKKNVGNVNCDSPVWKNKPRCN